MGGIAERAGLRIGDVVYGLNHKQVRSLEEFNRLLAQRAGGRGGSARQSTERRAA